MRENKNANIQEILKVSKILKDNGVNLEKIKKSKKVNGKSVYLKLSEIKQEGIDINRIIEENGLNGNFLFGYQLNKLRCLYIEGDLEPKDIELITKLNLFKSSKTNFRMEFFRIAEILKNNGVSLERINISNRNKDGVTYLKLSEIKQEGIDINKIIEENGLDGEFPFGYRVAELRQAYRGTGNSPRITTEEKMLFEKLGLMKIKR